MERRKEGFVGSRENRGRTRTTVKKEENKEPRSGIKRNTRMPRKPRETMMKRENMPRKEG